LQLGNLVVVSFFPFQSFDFILFVIENDDEEDEVENDVSGQQHGRSDKV